MNNEPIKTGDRAEIVEGALGTKGPNVGKIVTVGSVRGEHSQLGRIWRVHGQGLITEYGAVGDSVDCAASWLRKLPPDEKTDKHVAEQQDGGAA